MIAGIRPFSLNFRFSIYLTPLIKLFFKLLGSGLFSLI